MAFTWKLHTNHVWSEDEYIEQMTEQISNIDEQYRLRAITSIISELNVCFSDWNKARKVFHSMWKSTISNK